MYNIHTYIYIYIFIYIYIVNIDWIGIVFPDSLPTPSKYWLQNCRATVGTPFWKCRTLYSVLWNRDPAFRAHAHFKARS